MAFPSQNVLLLREALDNVRQAASIIKSGALNLRALSLTGNCGASSILGYATELAGNRAVLVANASTPGLPAYAQEQLNNPTLDIVAEYNSMLTAINNTRDWIIANFPKDAGNFLLSHTFNADGTQAERIFTSGSLAGLRTVLDALTATIV